MKTTIYKNKDFILIRKPHGIPSTFGNMESFLDLLKENLSEHTFTWTPLSELVPGDIFPLVSSRLKGFEEVRKIEENEELLRQQVDTFGQDQEFGLLNRLDNDTAGFLYFAKSVNAFDHFKSLQKSAKIQKFYIAQVEGTL
ncbi:MAG: pseudouridine synthase [bacterium]